VVQDFYPDEHRYPDTDSNPDTDPPSIHDCHCDQVDASDKIRDADQTSHCISDQDTHKVCTSHQDTTAHSHAYEASRRQRSLSVVSRQDS
jgi:hypothetical protein